MILHFMISLLDLTVYTLVRPLMSSLDPNILNIATTRTKIYGQQAFAYQGRATETGSLWTSELLERRTRPRSDWKQRYLTATIHKDLYCFIIFLYYYLWYVHLCIFSCCSILFVWDCLAFCIVCYHNLYYSYRQVLCVVRVLLVCCCCCCCCFCSI